MGSEGGYVWRLVSTEIRMMMDVWSISACMCGAFLHARYRGTDDEVKDGLSLECISVVMRKGRLRWFGHVERMDNGNEVKGVRSGIYGDAYIGVIALPYHLRNGQDNTIESGSPYTGTCTFCSVRHEGVNRGRLRQHGIRSLRKISGK